MPFISFASSPVGIGGIDTYAYFSPPTLAENAATFSTHGMTIPTGVEAITGRPSFCQFQSGTASRMYVVGAHTENLVVTENLELHKQGILPPTNPFVAGAGSGRAVGVAVAAKVSGGRTGECVCYLAFYDSKHVRRSPLSGASDSVTMTDQGLNWTNLPTTCEDRSVDKIELWVSMAGNTPRLSVRRDLGASSAFEDTPTLSLGEAYSEDFEKFPRCRYNIDWHDRQVMAGDDRHPDRIYFSLLNDFENYGGLFIKTRNGDTVRGLYKVRDNLFVGTDVATYIVTGYTEDDISINVLEPHVGLVCHHGVGYYDDFAIVPTQRGFYINNGAAMLFVSRGHEELWRSEYSRLRGWYENGFAVVDPNDDVYKFCVGDTPPGETPGTKATSSIYNFMEQMEYLYSMDSTVNKPESVYWVLDLSDINKGVSVEGGPQLSFDIRKRKDTYAAQMSYPNSSRVDVVTGSSDGYLRIEGQAQEDDDGDLCQMIWAIVTKHYDFGLEGAKLDDGFKLPYCWSFTEADSYSDTLTDYNFAVFAGGGHEFAFDSHQGYAQSYAFDTNNSKTFSAGWTGPEGNGPIPDLSGPGYFMYTPTTSNGFSPKGATGQGFTFVITAVDAGQLFWRGFGGKVSPGHARQATVQVEPPA